MTLGFLRILLCLSVVSYHSGFASYGPLAVLCFFSISGFVNTRSLGLKYSESIKEFAKARARRLIPDYLVCACFSYLILILARNIDQGAVSILRSQSAYYFQDPNVAMTFLAFLPKFYIGFDNLYLNIESPLVPLFWSVYCEIIYYLFLIFLHKIKLIKISILLPLSIILVINIIWLSFNSDSSLSDWNKNIYFNVISGLGFFLVGSTASLLNPRSSHFRTASKYFAIFVNIYILFGFKFLPRPENSFIFSQSLNLSLVSLICALFICLFLMLNYTSKYKVPDFKHESYFAYFSYGIYIWQSFVFLLNDFLKLYFNKVVLDYSNRFITFSFVLASSLLLAFILRMSRNRLSNIQIRRSAVA
jgi:peptidoglycan/LPS O-acetylase OafA/YrhL